MSRAQIKTGPTPRIAQMLGQAAELVATGKSLKQAAEKIGASYDALRNGRQRHADFSHHAVQEAEERLRKEQEAAADEILDAVRATAGTEAVLRAPREYLEMAELAAEWASTRYNEDLFPTNGKQTLHSFYRSWYVPNRLFQASPATLTGYECYLRRWWLVMGAIPIDEITQEHLRIFRDFLLATLKPVSAGTQLRNIQTLLTAAGPPDRYQRDAAGILERVPYIRRPRADAPLPKVVSLDTISSVYRAADQMSRPLIPGMTPAGWWRALLCLAYNTGLRRGTLFSLRWEMIDWDEDTLNLPPEVMKTNRYLILPLTSIMRRHLETLTDEKEDFILPYPYTHGYFDKLFRQLQAIVGLYGTTCFGLHHLRKTLATQLWAHDPAAAQLALGHATTTTQRHYVAALSVIRPALETLPQPEAFLDTNGG